jgi:hypothetical protein
MKRLLLSGMLVLIPVVAQVALAAGSIVPVSQEHAGRLYFGKYQAREPQSMSELPPGIRAKLERHLRARLGDEYYHRLTFSGGQIIDVEALHRAEPDSLHYQWEVPAYSLSFDFRLPDIGVNTYKAQIQLRGDGSVLKEIDLPPFAADPSKRRFVTLERASALADDRGYRLALGSVTLEYSKPIQSFVWRFSGRAHDNRQNFHFQVLTIDAHSGRIVGESKSRDIR